jgi:endoglycosylceramidase
MVRAMSMIRTTRRVTLLLALLVCAPSATAATPVALVAPLSSVGRWLVDATGRVVMLRGVNNVAKLPPYYPAAFGFGEDDVAFLVAEGFNAVRLGIDMRGLMPAQGQIDDTYLEHLATSVAECAANGVFVLLDIHQDGYAPKYNGNGFPDWMAIDDGLPNPPGAVFPTYYLTNMAMQRAFEHLWANSPLPGGLGIQDYLVQAVQRVATRFAGEPMVFGTDLINEPWPGAEWQPCIAPNGCGTLEAERLVPYYRNLGRALRALAPTQFAFVEPWVLFNFGQAPTTLPGTDPGVGLSFHSYALGPASEEQVARLGAEAATRDGAPVIVTEFGATTDAVTLNRLVGQFESQLLPWMFWHYSGEIVRDQAPPLTPDQIVSPAALKALVRPYPVATAGVPTHIAFDPATRVFDYTYTVGRAGGGSFPRPLDTVLFVPVRQYPDGYRVRAVGARVFSRCPTQIRLRTRRSAQSVVVQVTPAALGAKPQRPCRRQGRG